MLISPRLALVAVFLCLFLRPALSADAPAVGMVLDLQGGAQLIENGRSSKLQLLARLTPETQLELQAGAKASVTLYATRSVYRLTGPTVIGVTKEGLTVVKGAPPEVRVMGQKPVAEAPAGKFVTGAYRMRSIRVPPPVLLASPENGSVLLDTRPTFSWEAADVTSFTIALQAESGQPSYSVKVNGNQWALPEGVQLERGKSYNWSVAFVSQPEGETRSAAGKFSLATKSEADEFAALKPGDADPIEEWVYYAVLLQQRQMRGEARSVWQRIAQQRPDLERAGELARSP